MQTSPNMPESSRASYPANAVLKEAQSLLSSLLHRSGAFAPAEDSFGSNLNAKAPDLLLHCATLLEDFRQLPVAESNLQLKDWTVVRALVELFVRWGIYPYLSPGVGIPLHKRFGEKAAAAAAAAVSDHFQDASFLEPARRVRAEASAVLSVSNYHGLEMHPLVLSTGLLSSIALESSTARSTRTNLASTVDSCHNRTAVENLRKKEGELHESNGSEDKSDPGFSPPAVDLRRLVLSRHLVDVVAALLQIAHGQLLPSIYEETPGMWKRDAAETIKSMVATLPVAHLVEALFILLGEEGQKSPTWLKPEVGKLLSQVVMRDGGVATVMERLVGNAEKGSVHLYKRVAGQLARVPKSIATKDQYYKVVCKQLQLLLALPYSHAEFGSSSDIASRLLSNIHHTSILLACALAHQDPRLIERYLTRPIAEPLLCWEFLQLHGGTRSIGSAEHQASVAGLEKRTAPLTETWMVDILLKVQVLLTAGHEGSSYLRQQLLLLTAPLAPGLLLLNYLLWPSYAKRDGQRFQEKFSMISTNDTEIRKKEHDVAGVSRSYIEQIGSGKDFAKGFLLGKGILVPSSDCNQGLRPVDQFAGAVSDIVYAHLSEGVTHALPIICTSLFDLNAASFEWFSLDSDIAAALRNGKAESSSVASFVSKLLLWSENWELAITLLDKLFREVLIVRQASSKGSFTTGMITRDFRHLLHILEVIYVEVGLKAVEQAFPRALALLKALLADTDIGLDAELLGLLLPLVRSALNPLHPSLDDDGEETQRLNHNQVEVILTNLDLLLEKVQQSGGLLSDVKESATGLRSRISVILRNYTTEDRKEL